MNIITLNSGSSSVKYALWQMPGAHLVCNGIIDRVGAQGGTLTHRVPGRKDVRESRACPSHIAAIELVFGLLTRQGGGGLRDLSQIDAVAHRVVHGGEKYTESVLVDENVIAAIEENTRLAPLHNPHNLSGIRAAMGVLPAVPHIACWDTAFSARSMPPHARIYAIPYEYYTELGIRRFGYQGLSHLYVTRRATALMKRPAEELALVSLHVGNGSTVTAVKGGVVWDQSLGFSTCGEGLVMGTRCGDLDPVVPLFIMQQQGLTIEEMEEVLYRKSGMLGLTGKYMDRRDAIEAAQKGDQRAQLALDVECYRLKKYIGAYAAVLGGLDAVIFTAGVGESSPLHRERACEGLEFIGVRIDSEKNRQAIGRKGEYDISADDSSVRVFVIPTDEELVMAEDAQAILDGRGMAHPPFRYSFEEPGFQPTYCRVGTWQERRHQL